MSIYRPEDDDLQESEPSETPDHSPTEELARLKKELPEMRKENKRLTDFLQDAAAFIRSDNKDKLWNDNIILATLIHDIVGLADDKPCFSPRVTGYAQREQERNDEINNTMTKQQPEADTTTWDEYWSDLRTRIEDNV